MKHYFAAFVIYALLTQVACKGTSDVALARIDAPKDRVNIYSHVFTLPVGIYKGTGPSTAELAMLRIGRGPVTRKIFESKIEGAGWRRRTIGTMKGMTSEVYELADGSVIDVEIKRCNVDAVSPGDQIIVANWRT